jgi:hypothetical protein
MGRRKLSGTRGLNTPDEVSTKIGEPCSDISATRRAGDDLARWQSGQEGWAAASAARSTGDGKGGDPAVGGEPPEDPEGAFTSVDPWSAAPGPLQVAATVDAAELGEEGVGPTLAGRERVSATILERDGGLCRGHRCRHEQDPGGLR